MDNNSIAPTALLVEQTSSQTIDPAISPEALNDPLCELTPIEQAELDEALSLHWDQSVAQIDPFLFSTHPFFPFFIGGNQFFILFLLNYASHINSKSS